MFEFEFEFELLGVKSNNLSQVITMLTRDVEWNCEHKHPSINNCMFVGAWWKYHTTTKNEWMPLLSLSKGCICVRIYIARHTDYCVYTLFFCRSWHVCAPVIIIITITKEHLTELFEWEQVRACNNNDYYMTRRHTAKTHIQMHFIVDKKKVLQIVKWENE